MPGCLEILVSEDIGDLPTLRLRPEQALKGLGKPPLRIDAAADGVQLPAENAIGGMGLLTDVDR